MNSALHCLRKARIPERHSLTLSRCYAAKAPGTPFNENHKWLQRERAAANPETSRQVDALRDEVAFRLCERLLVSPREHLQPIDYTSFV